MVAPPALVACCLLAVGGSASAQTGGSGGGGAVFVAKPKISKVKCLRGCASRKRARAGSRLKITGSGFDSVNKIVFLGSFGRSDDVTAKARRLNGRTVYVRVPYDAITGPVALYTSSGLRSKRSKSVAVLPPPPPSPNPVLSAVPGPRERGAPQLETGTSRNKVYYGARRAVIFSYRIIDSAPATVKVELVRARDGVVTKSWAPPPVASGEAQTIVWNGKLGRVAAGQGRYSFRVTAAGRSGAVARSAQATDFQRDAFDLYSHIFPIRGRHDYGGAGAQFGVGRGGRSHQGHDVFARCGKRLVAARGGKVQYSGYQGAAGNYIVIDGSGTSVDYTYMHLAEPSPFRAGDRVYTGQRIGSVGDTGNAQGCHLHFELWSGPGWYDGGKAFDPEPALRAWDSWS